MIRHLAPGQGVFAVGLPLACRSHHRADNQNKAGQNHNQIGKR